MLSTEAGTQRALLKWIVDLQGGNVKTVNGSMQSHNEQKLSSTSSLTVTFLSKKYLSVSIKPRTISVKNKVFMLLSNTEERMLKMRK
jgi:hypothetical protein